MSHRVLISRVGQNGRRKRPIRVDNPFGMNSFHGVSSGASRRYSLKLRYGKASIFRVMACNDIGCGSYGSDNTGSVSCGGSGGGGGGGGGGVEPF